MPKIVIKEIDNTKAGVGLYSNFTVLVPGFVDEATYDDSGYDDNDVVELKTKKDFNLYVGKREPEASIKEAAVDAKRKAGDPIIFTDDPAGEGAKTAKEKLIAYLDGTGDPHLDANYYLYAWRPNTEGLHGLLRYYDDENKTGEVYTRVTLEMAEAETYQVESTGYFLIKIGDEGKNAITGVQYGNQIAYELIGLGYTVLYKKIKLISDLNSDTFWDALKDKSIYDFRYVINGLLTDNSTANKNIIDLANFVNPKEGEEVGDTGRGDCTALCDIDSSAYEGLTQAEAIKGIELKASLISTSKYAALFAPFVTYNLPYNKDYKNRTFPASFHYLACAAKAAENYNEWYAIAGYTRGISNYNIVGVGCKLGEEAVQALEPRYNTWDADKKTGVEKAINIIIKIKGNFYLWGNRTAEKLGTEGDEDGDLRASHFLNIRQLCSTIKKQVYVTCRRYTFDPNSDVLWINFCNDIRPVLEKMKADQGITDYKFIKVRTNQKGTLKAKIRIVPIEAVEDFDISLYLEDSISGTDVEIND